MKTSSLHLSFALFLLVMTQASFAEVLPAKAMKIAPGKENTSFAFFRTHRQGKGITATWGINSADNVLGFSVQRTYEDPTDPYANWEDLATVPFNFSRSFTYKDEEVFPGTITYRIVALLNDGSTVVSELSSIRIVSRH